MSVGMLGGWMGWLLLTAITMLRVSAQSVPLDTGIDGTWSTGSGAVETGQKYFNIVNDTFTVPPLTGQSYSFVSKTAKTGYWEQLLYMFNTSGTYSILTSRHSSWLLPSFVVLATWELYNQCQQLNYLDTIRP